MKKIYLFKMFLMALVLTLLGGVNAFAKTVTLTSTFTDKNWSVGTDEPIWTSSNKDGSYDSQYERGVSFGKNKGTLTLSSNESFTSVTQVVVVASANGTEGYLSVKIGETTIGSNKNIQSGTTNKNKEYKFSSDSKLDGIITITATEGNHSIWIKSISVTYETTDTKNFKYSASSFDAVLDGTNTFPSLTNDYGTSVTYDSSDKSVATIDAGGNITLVGSGTTTITATLAADNSVTASYTLNVARAKVWDLSVNQTTTATKEKIEWVDNVVTMTGDRGKDGTNANNYVGGIGYNSTRFYAKSTFSITPAEGITILNIEYFATTVGYATALANSTWTNATASANDMTVTIVPKDGTSKISATIGGTTGATKVIVYYTGEPTVENKTLVATDADGLYYATFSCDRDVVFSEDVSVNGVSIENGELKFNAFSINTYTTTNSDNSEVKGYYVPANTGVLIYALAEDKDITYYTAAGGQSFSLPTNQLVAATTNGKFTGDSDHKYYKLAYDDYVKKTGLGFYYGEAGGAAFEVKKGLAYLAVPVNGSKPAAGYAFGGNGGDDTTGINGIENDNVNETKTIYNLQGQRVEKAGLRGIYIVNGKKVVLK